MVSLMDILLIDAQSINPQALLGFETQAIQGVPQILPHADEYTPDPNLKAQVIILTPSIRKGIINWSIV
jgi:hypothetical protein